MAKFERWKDGRSGQSGRLAGNLVLQKMDPSEKRIKHFKGTVFEDEHHCWIGRVVGDDRYLTAGAVHWANISADQQRELLQYVKENDKKLLYLFITVHYSQMLVRYWQVPADVLSRELNRRGKNDAGDVLGLHITLRNGKYFLGEHDVSAAVAEIPIERGCQEELSAAVEADQARNKTVTQSAQVTVANLPVNGQPRRFDVPLSEGRFATFHVPIPITPNDVDRIKHYVDVIKDLLVA